MLETLFFFVFPRICAGFYAGTILVGYYRMRKRNIVQPWIYFALGLAGYNFLYALTWGWLQSFELVMMALCCIGMVVSPTTSMIRSCKELQRHKANQRYSQDNIAQLDAVQARWAHDEISNEEFDAFMVDMREKRLQYLQQEAAEAMRMR
jgi:uncharacterized membrane protein